MMFPSKKIVDEIKRQFPKGTRVELLHMDDMQAPPIGTKGTVRGVDDTGSILVSWDNGSGLNVVYGEDKCRKLDSVRVLRLLFSPRYAFLLIRLKPGILLSYLHLATL